MYVQYSTEHHGDIERVEAGRRLTLTKMHSLDMNLVMPVN